MRVGRRIAAGLCAVALMAALVAFPVRAKAAAGAVLPAIGYAATISAFLAACGIYPFQNESGESFGEWGARRLTEAWDTYVTEIYPESEGAQLISDVKSFYANGGYMVMARDTWDKLRLFAGWMKERFGLQANQASVQAGVVVSGFPSFPVSADYSWEGWRNVSQGTRLRYLALNGYYLGLGRWSQVDGSSIFAMLPSDYAGVEVSAFCVPAAATVNYTFFVSRSPFKFFFGNTSHDYSRDVSSLYTLRGVAYYATDGNYTLYPDSVRVPVFSSKEEGIAAFLGGTLDVFHGVTVDTGATVAIPDALPEGAELGGLAVAGAGDGAEALEDVIESGVMERQKPIVRPVEVEVGEGTAVDAGTGTVADETPSVITITPESVPLSVSDYSVPGLSGLFPFSIPWDIMRIWQVLDAEPRFPLQDFSLTLDIPLLFGDTPPSVAFDLQSMPQARQKVDEVAGVVRAFLYLVACIGFLAFVGSFLKF